MALATVSDILEETGVDYGSFGFTNDATFRAWVVKKIAWVDGKILALVGATNYADPDAAEDLKYAEVYWVFSTMMRRRYGSAGASMEGGFAIGSLRIDSGAKATSDTGAVGNEFFRKAQVLLQPWAPLTRADYLVVEDLEDE